MTEEKGGDGGGGESARVSSSFAAVGGRQRFTVELRPGETTIVSWKKLLKDKSKVNGPTSAPEPPSNAHPALESRIAPGQPPAEKEVNDEPPATRFSAVIEKIERLYMGKHSSDEEDLDDVPDDDEYDTEDSFIDDAELDEYFQVDNSAIKHDGFFVNRGKLERINEPTLTPHLQPKKRRRKDLEKGHDDDDGHIPNKHVKIGKKAVGKAVPLVGKSFDSPIRTTTVSTQHCEDVNFHNHMNASVICSKKKSNDIKNSLDPPPSKISNGNPSLTLAEENEIDKQKTGVVPFKNHGNKLKDGCEFSDASNQRSHDESSYAHFKSQTGKLSTSVDQSEQSVQRKEKSAIRDRPDIDGSEGKHSMQAAKVPLMHRKEGSSARPKSTMLEKSIRELHKMVTELRPPAGEITDADFSSQGIKKRLPPELKQKLAKVARLAQANQGKLSKELINRLMSILGHLMQLRTLKRHLKVMANMALSAKQEKDDKFQQIKKEVAEMIKTRVPSPKSKAVEHQAGSSDDFQETGNEKKEVKRKCSMDDAMEDKICDLYNLYVEGLDEDAGPQVRKLYAELAELWPNGCMDNHGIKRGICRAKDRRRALRHKEQQKIKRKKLLATRIEETVRAEASSISQPQYMQEKMITDSGNQSLSSLNRPVSNTTITSTTPSVVRTPGPLINNPSLDRPKQDKLKGNSRNPRTVEGLAKKKVKRKPELALGETQIRPEKKNSALGEVRNKVQKQQVHVLALPQKPISQSSIPLPSSVQQS